MATDEISARVGGSAADLPRFRPFAVACSADGPGVENADQKAFPCRLWHMAHPIKLRVRRKGNVAGGREGERRVKGGGEKGGLDVEMLHPKPPAGTAC